MPLFLPNTPPLLANTGWVDATSETWTYASGVGTNVGTFTISGVDLTGKYQAGDRVKFTQTTVKYAIITKVAFSTDTTVTIYMGTDYTIANAAISANSYSKMKSPQGFPLDPAKWTEQTVDTASRSQGSPTTGTWYNLGSLSLTIPIGVWNASYQVSQEATKTSSTAAGIDSTLSTANNSESDTNWTTRSYVGTASGTAIAWAPANRTNVLTLTSSTTYYLNANSVVASSTSIIHRGDVSPTIIRAVSAYL